MDDFREIYKQMDDDQLLGLCREREGLEPEALTALQAEMGLRRIGFHEADAFGKHLDRTEKKEKRRRQRRSETVVKWWLWQIPGSPRTRVLIALVVLLILLLLELLK